MKIYHCEGCDKILINLGEQNGTLGKTELIPGSVDAATEKHVPVQKPLQKVHCGPGAAQGVGSVVGSKFRIIEAVPIGTGEEKIAFEFTDTVVKVFEAFERFHAVSLEDTGIAEENGFHPCFTL